MIFHKHHWEVISAKDYTSQTWSHFEGKYVDRDYTTNILYKCYCGKHKSESINGHHAKKINEEAAERKSQNETR